LIWHARGIDPMRRALEARCCDGFNCSGGLAEFDTIAHAVETAGYSCWHGSMAELGIGQVAHLHAAAASRCCTMASDFVSGFVREHTLITWDWPYRDASLPLPDGPGLGIELDEAAANRFTKAEAAFGTF
jgi:muconate cycloisomerase